MATARVIPFELEGADGEPLRGDVRVAGGGEGRPAVVICHGLKGFKDWGFFPHLAARLARAGMTAVTFNFSGSGVGADLATFSEPDRFRRATISNHLTDLERVAAALREGCLAEGIAAPTGVGLLGHSLGGGVAILWAAQDPACRSLVTWAAVGSFVRWDPTTVAAWRRRGTLDVVNARTGEILPLATDYLDDLEADASGRLDLTRAAGSIVVPWLIVHGDADESVAPADAEAHLGAATRGTASLFIVPGAGHTFGARHPWAGSTAELDGVLERTVGWCSRSLL